MGAHHDIVDDDGDARFHLGAIDGRTDTADREILGTDLAIDGLHLQAWSQLRQLCRLENLVLLQCIGAGDTHGHRHFLHAFTALARGNDDVGQSAGGNAGFLGEGWDGAAEHHGRSPQKPKSKTTDHISPTHISANFIDTGLFFRCTAGAQSSAQRTARAMSPKASRTAGSSAEADRNPCGAPR